MSTVAPGVVPAGGGIVSGGGIVTSPPNPAGGGSVGSDGSNVFFGDSLCMVVLTP